MPKTRIQIGLSGSRIPPEELAYYNSIKIPFREPQGHWEYFIVKPDSDEEWQALQKRLGPYVSFGKEWTRESKETKFMSEMSRIAAIIKELDQQSVEETTNVTDYNPSSQGGTRQELLAKYHKTRDPKDAEAARKAGATQQELQGMAEGAPELLKAELPLVRHIENELIQHGYEKGTPEYDQMFKHSVAMYRKFGNIDAIRKAEGMAEGFWQDAVKKAEAEREARKGKPFEKNPASHDKQGVYKGDKDLSGNPVPKRKEQSVAEEFDQLEEGQIMDFLKKVGLATAVIGTLGLPGAIEMHFLHKTPLVQEIKRQAEQGNEQAKEDLDNLSVTLGSGRTGPTMVLLNRYGFKNVEEPESNDEREQYQETLARQLSKISDQLLG